MNHVTGAILEYKKTSDTDAGFECRSALPTDQPLIFKFNKNTGYQQEVPIRITYKNLTGKEVVFHENYAQHLLDSYPFLSLVRMVEKPIVETPILVDKRASANNALAKKEAEIEELKAKMAEMEAKIGATIVEVPVSQPQVETIEPIPSAETVVEKTENKKDKKK